MFCSKCGTANVEANLFCTSCGNSLKPTASVSPVVATSRQKTPLLLGIVALVLFCIPGLPFILSIIGLILGILYFNNNQIRSSKGLAISGIVLNSIALLISGIILGAILKFTDNIENDEDIFDYFPDYDVQDYNLDTNFDDIDSLMLDTATYNNLDNTTTDTLNGPGSAPD